MLNGFLSKCPPQRGRKMAFHLCMVEFLHMVECLCKVECLCMVEFLCQIQPLGKFEFMVKYDNSQYDLELKFFVWLKPAFGEEERQSVAFLTTGERLCQHAILLCDGNGLERHSFSACHYSVSEFCEKLKQFKQKRSR